MSISFTDVYRKRKISPHTLQWYVSGYYMRKQKDGTYKKDGVIEHPLSECGEKVNGHWVFDEQKVKEWFEKRKKGLI